MDRSILMALVVVFMFAMLLLLALGWRARKKRQSGVAAPSAPPAELGTLLGEFTGKYVATTAHDDAFDRIAVHGLGFRGPVVVGVATDGLVVKIVGAAPVWIARAELRGIRRATWTIDRAVEKDGLHLVEWTLAEKVVDSYFRMDAPTEFGTAASSIIERETA